MRLSFAVPTLAGLLLGLGRPGPGRRAARRADLLLPDARQGRPRAGRDAAVQAGCPRGQPPHQGCPVIHPVATHQPIGAASAGMPRRRTARARQQRRLGQPGLHLPLRARHCTDLTPRAAHQAWAEGQSPCPPHRVTARPARRRDAVAHDRAADPSARSASARPGPARQLRRRPARTIAPALTPGVTRPADRPRGPWPPAAGDDPAEPATRPWPCGRPPPIDRARRRPSWRSARRRRNRAPRCMPMPGMAGTAATDTRRASPRASARAAGATARSTASGQYHHWGDHFAGEPGWGGPRMGGGRGGGSMGRRPWGGRPHWRPCPPPVPAATCAASHASAAAGLRNRRPRRRRLPDLAGQDPGGRRPQAPPHMCSASGAAQAPSVRRLATA